MKRIRAEYNIPGFRNPEKVPTDMLINACGGQKQFDMVCVEEVLHTTIEEVRLLLVLPLPTRSALTYTRSLLSQQH